MREKEKTRPSAATLERETAETEAGQATVPFDYFITGKKERQLPKLQISEMLPHGRGNALKMRELKELFSKDSRAIRLLIQRERRHVPIISDNASGYWVSNNETEIRQFTRSMRHRARQIWRTAENVERAAGLPRRESQQLEGQETLFNGGDA